VFVNKTTLTNSRAAIKLLFRLLETSMTMPTLAYDRPLVVARAHRMRGAVTAKLIRTLYRWATVASR
jgi:hypothetical protein